MTTTVIIQAHCSTDKEVVINRGNDDVDEAFILHDGETYEHVVYDDISINVKEREKEK